MNASCVIAIETDDVLLQRRARAFAQQADLAVTTNGVNAPLGSLILAMRDDGWELRDIGDRPGTGARVEFDHVLRSGGGGRLSRRQPLARAVGSEARQVVDATAGLAHDASLLAAMGYHVVAMERHPVLATLLEEGLRRARHDARLAELVAGRLTVVCADARSALKQLPSEAIDCVYIDPMYPPKRKRSALARKEIRLVRALVGNDEDANELLTIARQSAPRVAVKRPHHAPPLQNDVHATVTSKLVRYDLYMAR